MTICPKCGKAYLMTPDICEDCGTALTDPDFQDPFAEAVREEAELRRAAEQRREARLAPKLPRTAGPAEPDREEDEFAGEDGSEAAEKPRRTGLRIAAAAAAFAVAAGGWYGWKRFGGGSDSSAEDLIFFDGDQPCFYDGRTGQTHLLGDPIMPYPGQTDQLRAAFFEHTVVSEDRSHVFYPDFRAADSGGYERFVPRCCNLSIKDAPQYSLLPLKNYYEQQGAAAVPESSEGALSDNALLVTEYSLLDESGLYVLLDMEDGKYSVWKDPEKFGMSIGQEIFSAADVIPTNMPGKYFCLRENQYESEEERPVLLNDTASIETDYMLELVDVIAGNTVTLNTCMLTGGYGRGGQIFGEPADSEYYFYTAYRLTDHIVGTPFRMSLGDKSIIVGENSFRPVSGFPDNASDAEVQEYAVELMGRSLFAYGTEAHRVNLRTGEDTVVFFDETRIDMIWGGFPDGTVWHVGFLMSIDSELNEEDEITYTLSCYGVTESGPAEIVLSDLKLTGAVLDENSSPAMYAVCKDGEGLFLNGCSCMTVDQSAFDGKKVIDIMVSEAGDRVMFRTSDNTYYGAAIQPEETMTPKPVAGAETEFFSGDKKSISAAYIGSEPVVARKELADDERQTLRYGYTVASENCDGDFIRYDPATGALYFTEFEQPYTAGSSYRRLCRFADGKTVCIADRIVDGTIEFRQETGGFAFVRLEERGEKKYAVYTGGRESDSLKTCARVGDGYSSLPSLCPDNSGRKLFFSRYDIYYNDYE